MLYITYLDITKQYFLQTMFNYLSYCVIANIFIEFWSTIKMVNATRFHALVNNLHSLI